MAEVPLCAAFLAEGYRQVLEQKTIVYGVIVQAIATDLRVLLSADTTSNQLLLIAAFGACVASRAAMVSTTFDLSNDE